MAATFYDFSVGTYLQTLGAVSGYMKKGREHCETSGIDLDGVVETRLYEDMLPFRFQIVSVAHHSLGAIKGVQAGTFSPPPAAPDRNFSELEQLVAETSEALQTLSRESVDALAGRDVQFKMGERVVPFVAENFILSFSLPNFYFHAATAYDILRMQGTPIGKRDFMGPLRMKA